jgi:putative membrane protein
MNNPISRFIVRWLVCSLGLWIAAIILGPSRIDYDGGLFVILVAGLVLAVVNTILKPIIVMLSLPAILFSLGLFMIVINAIMVLMASWLYSRLDVDGFGAALMAGIIIGLVNYLVTALLEERNERKTLKNQV